METHGPKLLGAEYKDPITSFKQFHEFSVEHPEASSFLAQNFDSNLGFGNITVFLFYLRSIGLSLWKSSPFAFLSLQPAFLILLTNQNMVAHGFLVQF